MSELKAGIYEHYKGKQYLALGVARHSETEEKLVAYVPLYSTEGPGITVRPYEMFFDEVEVGGELKPRFIYIGEISTKDIRS